MLFNKIFQYIKSHKISILLVVINVVVFATYGFQDINSLILLDHGANFAPYALDDQAYRLITSMFLHGYFLHLAANMYGLLYLGPIIETQQGPISLLRIYFFTGILAGFASAWFNLFTISVGASGAIFGLYGYYIVKELESRNAKNRLPVIINFLLYLIFMSLLGSFFNFDNAGHFGGAIAGVVLRFFDRIFDRKNVAKWIFVSLVIPLYFLLPRYQVTYFKAFQSLLVGEKAINAAFNANLRDIQLLQKMKEISELPDSIWHNFERIKYLPEELREDTTTIAQYLDLKKQQIDFYLLLLSKESYIYKDSIQHVSGLIAKNNALKYVLNMQPPEQKNDTTATEDNPLIPSHQFYDENWFESNEINAAFYRYGQKDSLGDWHGPVEDYYISGAIQMKGALDHGLKHGIFIYYNDDSTYSSAGRYYKDDAIGKWESFHSNGLMASEIRYGKRGSFIENTWDSLGNAMVANGNGTEEIKDDKGFVVYKRKVENGKNNGIVEGFNEKERLSYREFYENGKLVEGIAREENGSTHTYDVSTLLPFPDGGYDQFTTYLKTHNHLVSDTTDAYVHLRFDVHHTGQISNIRYLKRLGPPYDQQAKQLLLDGPKWFPARLHGYLPISSYAEIYVEF